ncbi:MAG TPA: ATP-binding cassette domain-containing protein [Syntrophorhabdaceae bacterium]|nr:ATP-binding cassette domain-containing protein [Syntrophorhabdaceae bacterium]
MGLNVQLQKKVSGFSLNVAWDMENELVVLFGHSGSGKSMTLQLIAGLADPDEGRICFGDKVLFDRALGINLPPQKRSVGYVFQDRVLFPHMTVWENIGYGLKKCPKAEKQDRIRQMIRLLYLEGLENKHPGQISGGEKQRVTLARALIGRPEVLLLDEPFSALDNPLRIEMRELLRDVQRQFNVPIILVSHDMLEAYSIGDKIVLYSQGKIAGTGTPQEVFSSPLSSEIDLYLSLNFPLLISRH